MRVLVGCGNGNGGEERVAHWLVESLSSRGVDVDLWTPPPDESVNSTLAKACLRGLPKRWDVVNVHHRRMELGVRLARVPYDKRRYVMHNLPHRQPWVPPGSPTACPSRTTIREVGFQRVSYLPNPVAGTWRIGPSTGREVTLLWMARIVAGKNWPLWLEVVRKLAGRGIDVQGHVFGSGPDAEAMTTRADALGLRRRVEFHGYVPPQQLEVPEGSVLLVTSSEETAPLTPLEAAASGVPVVATPVGDLPEHPDAWRLATTADGLAELTIEAAHGGADDQFLKTAAALAADHDPDTVLDAYLSWFSATPPLRAPGRR